MRASHVVAAVAATMALSCGSSTKVGSQPSWRTSPETGGDVELPQASGKPIVLEPATPGARDYNSRDRGEVPRAAIADAVVAAVGDAAEQNHQVRPVADARLFAVANDLVGVARQDAPVPHALVEFSMRHHGVIEPTPHLLFIWGPPDHHEEIAARLRERLPSALADSPVSRVGVGWQKRGKSGVILLVLQASFIDTEPVPRVVSGDGVIRLRARIHAPYREPELFVTREDGVVAQPRVTVRGDRIEADVSCAGRRGPQQIEITAINARGSNVLANFPVWCNAEPPATATIGTTAPEDAAVSDAGEAERQMLALVNRDRAAAGVPPVTLYPPLSAVAREHSEEMRATGNVAHVSPTTGSAADRVKAGGIATAVVLENVARAYGVLEAQEGLMNSPGHRANILSRDVTHIGVGVVLGEEVMGRRELFVTQVFIRVPPRIDPATASREREIALAKATNLAVDPALSGIAQQFARDLSKGLTNEAAAKRSGAKLDKLAERYRRVTTIVNPVADLAQFPWGAVAQDQTMTHFGIGMAQGSHPVIGDGAIYVVVLVGQLR